MEIAYNPGVMDPWEESTCKGIRDAGIETVSGVKTGRQYLICGRLTAEQLTFIGEKLLYNRVIQHAVKLEHLKKTLEAHKDVGYTFEKNIVALLDLDDAGLMAVSKQRQLYLTLEEMHTVKKHFSRLGRNPTDCELETIAQTWSEHCVHKTMRGVVDYTDASLPKRKNP
jgi:Phosphoribosylformylglycinamidine (FGAM) synthase, synthetase domain